MTDIVLDVELRNDDEDVRLAEAIDCFLLQQASAASPDGFDLDLMVRTALGPGGERLKQVVFQQSDLAQAFHTFWESFRGLA